MVELQVHTQRGLNDNEFNHNNKEALLITVNTTRGGNVTFTEVQRGVVLYNKGGRGQSSGHNQQV